MLQKVLSLKTLVHAVMLAFAAASFSNVKAYLEAAGHHHEAAIILGAALGASLVTVSVMLTHVDRATDKPTFNLLLLVGAGLGLLSGSLQAAEYAKHLGLLPACLLGFGIPLGGEVGLAFATSAYSRARERFRSVSLAVEAAVANVLDDAIAGFDPTPIRVHVDKTITRLGRLAVDSAGVQAAQYYARTDAHERTPATTDAPTETTTDAATDAATVHTGESNAPLDDGRTKANAAKRTRAAQRQEALLHILRTEYDGTPTDALNKTQLGERLGATRQTVGRDLDALAAAQRVTLNGHVTVAG